MSDNPFVGSWTYRSLLNDADLSVAFDDLEFGRGTIVIKPAPMQLLTGNFQTTFAILGEQKGDRSKFTWKYYVPYFAEMKKQGHVEAFVYYTHQRSASPEVSEWFNQNKEKVATFLAWSKNYSWPKID